MYVNGQHRTVQHNLLVYILVKLQWTHVRQLEGLSENVIPVEPIETKMDIMVSVGTGKTVQCTVQ